MNKHYLLASVSVSGLVIAGGASAADLPVKAPSVNWTGWYGGLNSGVLVHKSVTKDLDNWADEGYVSSFQLKSFGGMVGGQFGYNWQDDGFVYGFEADIDWVSNTKSQTMTMCQGCTGGPGNV